MPGHQGLMDEVIQGTQGKNDNEAKSVAIMMIENYARKHSLNDVLDDPKWKSICSQPLNNIIPHAMSMVKELGFSNIIGALTGK